jgi:hypothetical protein
MFHGFSYTGIQLCLPDFRAYTKNKGDRYHICKPYFTTCFYGFPFVETKVYRQHISSYNKERIIPYAAMMFFGFWAWNVFNHLSYSPPVFTQFLLGTFITVIAGWLANIYYKISMHGLGIGGMLAFVIYISLTKMEAADNI